MKFIALATLCTAYLCAADVVVEAREARDRADIVTLRSFAEDAGRQASQTNTFDDYARAALIQNWLCEAAYASKDEKLVKGAASEGIRAAKVAVRLKPESSLAHWLLGDLLGKLLPHVFGGAFRYGRRSVHELDTAIELNGSNANASISRAIAYFMTPSLFGGDKRKAIALLRKATAQDPSPDSPDTAHIWLALALDGEGQKKEALREISEAKRLNPARRFTAQAYERIAGRER